MTVVASTNSTQFSNWSLNINDWDTLAETFREFPVKHFRFQTASLPLIPSGSGVYMVSLSPSRPAHQNELLSRLYNVVYVGQAVNLQTRCRKHLQGATSVGEALRAFHSLDFWFLECPSEQMNEIEKRIYDVISPMSNRISPPIRAKLGKAQMPQSTQKGE
jgi:hypothetical protein